MAPHIEPTSVEDQNAPVRVGDRYIRNRPEQFDCLRTWGHCKQTIADRRSGRIESAHRYVIQERLKIPGAWWPALAIWSVSGGQKGNPVVGSVIDNAGIRCSPYVSREPTVTGQLGIKRYETALLMRHKLRAAMVRPGRDRIGTEWPVEVDETYVGGATHGEGRGRHHKTLVVGMVEVLPRKQALGPDPNLPSGQRPQYRGGHGRSFIAGR